MEPVVVQHRNLRMRARRKPSLLRAIFYGTSVLPAVWIAWHFQLFNMGARRATPQAMPRTNVEPATSPKVDRGAVARPAEEPPQVVLEDDSPRETNSARRKPSNPAPQLVLAPAVSVDHTIDLDLQPRRQRHKLPKSTPSKFRIVALDGCNVSYDIRPAHGQIDERNDAVISIGGPREVTLQIGVAAAADESPVISIEVEAVTEAGDRIPFTISNVTRVRGQIVKEGKRASAELDAMYEERDRLNAWIAAPMVKPLAARGQARVRVAELASAISPLESLVKSLRADLALADDMEELAAHLNSDCRVQISNGH